MALLRRAVWCFALLSLLFFCVCCAPLQPALRGSKISLLAAYDCELVFVDVGSNRGVHGRFFFEPEKYPNAKKMLSYMEQVFGDASRRREKGCVFAFEPNPLLRARQLDLERAYRAKGFRYTFVGAAFGGSSLQSMNFTTETSDSAHSWWGSHLGTTDTRKEGRKYGRLNVTQVQVLDGAAWIKQNVLSRRHSPCVSNGSCPSTMVKVDCEGCEFEVLPALAAAEDAAPMNISFLTYELHGKPKENFKQLLASKPHWISFDSEAYLLDGVPLP